MNFLVWDKINSSREDASTISLLNRGLYTAQEAAETYAQRDVDGGMDGLYTADRRGEPCRSAQDGHPIIVEHLEGPEKGKVQTFLVAIIEYEPVWASVEKTDE